MDTVERLQEKRQIELAKSILESAGYKIIKEAEGSNKKEYNPNRFNDTNKKANAIFDKMFPEFSKYVDLSTKSPLTAYGSRDLRYVIVDEEGLTRYLDSLGEKKKWDRSRPHWSEGDWKDEYYWIIGGSKGLRFNIENGGDSWSGWAGKRILNIQFRWGN